MCGYPDRQQTLTPVNSVCPPVGVGHDSGESASRAIVRAVLAGGKYSLRPCDGAIRSTKIADRFGNGGICHEVVEELGVIQAPPSISNLVWRFQTATRREVFGAEVWICPSQQSGRDGIRHVGPGVGGHRILRF